MCVCACMRGALVVWEGRGVRVAAAAGGGGKERSTYVPPKNQPSQVPGNIAGGSNERQKHKLIKVDKRERQSVSL